MRIAIVGSGIAGLSAAWALSARHEVTLYEARHALGMDAHSLDVVDGDATHRIDVPLRVFHAGYYPTLISIYRAAGVEFVPVDSSASFTDANDRLLFRYGNVAVGRHRVPWLTRAGARSPRVVATGVEAAAFLIGLERTLRSAHVGQMVTFGDYLDASRHSERFKREFLLPAVAGICTCSYDAVRAFPADVVLRYMQSPGTRSMLRAREGAREVARRLTANVRAVRLSSPVQDVRRETGAVVVESGGTSESFDHVVFATQADQVAGLLDARDDERKVLEAFPYETSALVVHTDARLAPANRAWWSPVNYRVTKGTDAPMTTVVLSMLHPKPWTGPPVFQTWNPHFEPDPATVLGRVRVERALIDSGTRQGVDGLAALHDEPGRRVWFCGSYAGGGMTLQESAAASALDVAARIDAA